MRRLQLLWIFLFVILLTSCIGTSEIIVTNPNTKIYVNGQVKGNGTAKITRMGLPKKILIEAKNNNKVVGSKEERREFTFITLLFGSLSYGSGFLWAWQFPKTILVSTDESIQPNISSQPSQSVWDNPPPSQWE